MPPAPITQEPVKEEIPAVIECVDKVEIPDISANPAKVASVASPAVVAKVAIPDKPENVDTPLDDA